MYIFPYIFAWCPGMKLVCNVHYLLIFICVFLWYRCNLTLIFARILPLFFKSVHNYKFSFWYSFSAAPICVYGSPHLHAWLHGRPIPQIEADFFNYFTWQCEERHAAQGWFKPCSHTCVLCMTWERTQQSKQVKITLPNIDISTWDKLIWHNLT